jgi:hypothetical protein
MMPQVATRLPPARPKLTQESRKAIEAGMDLLRSEGYQVSFPESLPSIVWRLLREAADTLARLPDRERVWLLAADRVAWPEVLHTAQEMYEAELQRLTDTRMSKEETPIRRLSITNPGAVSRMLVVLDWLQYVRARTEIRVKRDKLVVLALAQGQSLKSVRRLMLGDRTDRAIYMVRSKVLSQIVGGLRNFLI